jgi:hypothetical protein
MRKRKQNAEVLMTKKAFNEIQLTLNSNNNNNTINNSSSRRNGYESHVKAEKKKKNKRKLMNKNFPLLSSPP